MTDKEIKEILLSNDLSEIELAITNKCQTYINSDHLEFLVDVIRREIVNSGLSIMYLRKYLVLKKQEIVDFGVKILLTSIGKPIEEEYPKGENIPVKERPQDIGKQGVAIGFAVKYAIYYHYLEKNRTELINYIRKERIPKADKFCRTLVKLYSS